MIFQLCELLGIADLVWAILNQFWGGF